MTQQIAKILRFFTKLVYATLVVEQPNLRAIGYGV